MHAHAHAPHALMHMHSHVWVLNSTIQLPEGDEEAAAGNREIANASVVYSIADPGSGINFMRSSLGDGSADSAGAIESYEQGQVILSHAVFDPICHRKSIIYAQGDQRSNMAF